MSLVYAKALQRKMVAVEGRAYRSALLENSTEYSWRDSKKECVCQVNRLGKTSVQRNEQILDGVCQARDKLLSAVNVYTFSNNRELME